MARSIEVGIADILTETENVAGVVTSLDFEQFSRDWRSQRAVEQGLEIISEASRYIQPDLQALCPDIQWRKISGIGSILRHEYQRVEPRIIWDTALASLPALVDGLKLILVHLEESHG